ncbi:MAG: stage II sporulation protein P [Lachnospiraceae bacterium]|nr:stage II sporulation protein P [Lachnospiraceae bacterium]
MGAALIAGVRKAQGGEGVSLADAARSMAAEYSAEKIIEQFLPFFSYAQRKDAQGSAAEMLSAGALQEFPIYGYYMKRAEAVLDIQDEQTYELLTQGLNTQPDAAQQGQKQPDQDGPDAQNQNGQGMQDQADETQFLQTVGEELLYAMEQENRGASSEAPPGTEDLEDIGSMENLDIAGASTFLRHQQINFYDWEALREYKNLVATFYAIDAGTMAGSDQLNIEALLSEDVTIDKNGPSPQILIYHTHSLEGFSDSVPGDRSQTIVGVGDRLTQILTEEYGYGVLHHTEEYDTVRDDAYAKSLPALQQILEEYPSIQVVIDLHRDAGIDGTRRVIDLDGRPTATFMLFNGLSRTRKTGDIDYLKNPNLDFNLAFSFQMQVIAGEYYPGLTRRIYLKAYRYNMHLMPRTLLIELGDSNNTVEEVMNTCDPLAHILDMVLSGESGE